MSFHPVLACGPSFSMLLLVLAPIGNFIVTFVAGAICSAMGNKKVGGWMMGLSAVLGSIYAAFVFG